MNIDRVRVAIQIWQAEHDANNQALYARMPGGKYIAIVPAMLDAVAEIDRLRGVVVEYRQRCKMEEWHNANAEAARHMADLHDWNVWSAAYDAETARIINGD